MELPKTLNDRGAPGGLPLVAAFLVNETPAFDGFLRGLLEAWAQEGIRPDDPADGKAQYLVCLYGREQEGPSGKAGLRSPQLLAPRERQVVQCLGRGLRTDEIAARLVITRRTVKAHLQAIYAKLDVHDRVAAVMRALMCGELRIGE